MTGAAAWWPPSRCPAAGPGWSPQPGRVRALKVVAPEASKALRLGATGASAAVVAESPRRKPASRVFRADSWVSKSSSGPSRVSSKPIASLS